MALDNIANSIIKYISGFDSAGKSSSSIDTLLEFNKLGEYLSGGYIHGEVQFSELSRKDKNSLKKLYESLKDTFDDFVSDKDKMPKITAENAENYADLCKQLDRENNRDETSELTYKKLQQALYKFAADNGYNLNDLKPEDVSYTFVIREVMTMIATKQKRAALAEKTLKNINEPYDSPKIELKAKEYIKENNIGPVTVQDDVDLGNGKFDKPATQKTEVCWALAGMNALLTTEKGKKLLESNRYYDKETGIFAIHLQEAEDNGFHDGIYIITPENIRAESQKLADGEGDAAAYIIAIKRYFAEVNKNPELAQKMESEKHTVRDLDYGNYGFRFFEILTGGEFTKYNYQDAGRQLQNGIGTGDTYSTGGFNEIYDTINNKSGAVTMTIAAHSISVVGARDGKLIIQESNNSEDFAAEFSDKERNHIIFKRIEDINGAPAYELSQDDYEHYIRAVSFLKW